MVLSLQTLGLEEFFFSFFLFLAKDVVPWGGECSVDCLLCFHIFKPKVFNFLALIFSAGLRLMPTLITTPSTFVGGSLGT